ncbi:MAG: hypothetical protein WB784_08570 [Rhodanobacteraceae bacterium]
MTNEQEEEQPCTHHEERMHAAQERMQAAHAKAWWRNMTKLVGENDQQLAVIGPRANATAEDLRSLGAAIERWKAGFPQARHIWGLADLLEGRHPRTPPMYFMIPIIVPLDGGLEWLEKSCQPVALVHVAEGTDMEAAVSNLSDCLSAVDSKLAFIEHPASFSYSRR